MGTLRVLAVAALLSATPALAQTALAQTGPGRPLAMPRANSLEEALVQLRPGIAAGWLAQQPGVQVRHAEGRPLILRVLRARPRDAASARRVAALSPGRAGGARAPAGTPAPGRVGRAHRARRGPAGSAPRWTTEPAKASSSATSTAWSTSITPTSSARTPAGSTGSTWTKTACTRPGSTPSTPTGMASPVRTRPARCCGPSSSTSTGPIPAPSLGRASIPRSTGSTWTATATASGPTAGPRATTTVHRPSASPSSSPTTSTATDSSNPRSVWSASAPRRSARSMRT